MTYAAVCIAIFATIGIAGEARAQSTLELGPGLQPSQGAAGVMLVEPIAEKVVSALPLTPLYWRVYAFSSVEEARRAEGPLALAAQAWGGNWLFSLAPAGDQPAAGRFVTQIGPVPVPPAKNYRLRINRAGGPPGVKTPVHSHPGSEAFHVLRGRLVQRSQHGETTLEAGRSMNGHEPGMVMQLTSAGHEPLEQLVMFVVDADEPFSTPAAFD